MDNFDLSKGHPCYDNGDNGVTNVFQYTEAEAHFMVMAAMIDVPKLIEVDDLPTRPPKYEVLIQRNWGAFLQANLGLTVLDYGVGEAVTLIADTKFDAYIIGAISAVVADRERYDMIEGPLEAVIAKYPEYRPAYAKFQAEFGPAVSKGE